MCICCLNCSLTFVFNPSSRVYGYEMVELKPGGENEVCRDISVFTCFILDFRKGYSAVDLHKLMDLKVDETWTDRERDEDREKDRMKRESVRIRKKEDD